MESDNEIRGPLAVEGMDEETMGVAPTNDEVELWTAELRDIDLQLAELNERKALLQQVLETIPMIEKLRGNIPLAAEAERPPVQAGAVGEFYAPKLVNAIPLVLEKYRKPMTPGQIKSRLKEVGFTKEFGETYFYTAVKRAVEKKTIAKKRDGRYVYIDRGLNGVDRGT
jgi:hypothetical protein